ncbi:MAG TPA: glutathione S-transferase family protein [Alphaproteobacteria bacterium]|nr:glutathione S-transferase family protein [Alphaproteobacteria bacterium]
MYTLIASRGAGSAIVEAALDIAGLPYSIREIDPWTSQADSDLLRSYNLLGQVPTLLMPDGSVMTESAAIVLHIADRAPEADLAPAGGDAARPWFLRWLEFFVASIYPTFTFGDEPSRWVSDEAAQRELRERTDRYREELWQVVEAGVAPAPWLFGDRFSALDLYVSAMTRWRPRRAWFQEHCPKLHTVACAVDGDPRVAKAWARNFS